MEFFGALLVIFTLPLILTAENKTFGTLPRNCQEAVQPWLKMKATQPNYPIDDVYLIETPNSGLEPYEVYCERDPNGGPYWSIIQRRINGSVNFYRNFTQYENGFGYLNHEYWLGLKKLRAVTDAEETELWVKLVDDKNKVYNAFYAKFFVGIASKYIFYVGKYSGNATNGLVYNTGRAFTAYDYSRDDEKRRCAVSNQDAWWHRSCSFSNLNGPYKPCNSYVGLCFDDSKSDERNIKYVHMAMRPVYKI